MRLGREVTLACPILDVTERSQGEVSDLSRSI